MFAPLLLSFVLAAPPHAPTQPPQAPPVKVLDYAACLLHVEAGGKAILAVGVDSPPGAYRVATLGDFAPGLWECFLDGTPKMRPLAVPKAMEPPAKQYRKVCRNGVCTLEEVSP